MWLSSWTIYHRHDLLTTAAPKKCIEQHKDPFLIFIDLTKAFDTVNRDGLWAILAKIGCPAKFVNI